LEPKGSAREGCETFSSHSNKNELFGPARIGGVGKSLGEAIRSFRHAVRDDDGRRPVAEEHATAQPYTPENKAQLQESTNASE